MTREPLIPTGNPRLVALNERDVATGGSCVLLWVQRAQRASGNLAADFAIETANRLQLPVIALFSLTANYPRATLRAYHFMVEGVRELPDAFAKRGVGWLLRTGEPSEIVPLVAREHRAALVVTDLDPLRTGRGWRAEVADRLDVPLIAVDADVVVPTALIPKEEWAPRTIRPKLRPHLDAALEPTAEPRARVRSDIRDGPDPIAALDDLPLDRSVGPATDGPTGGPTEARRLLRMFIAKRLGRYDEDRERADINGTSRLSAYLHFGQIGPIEIARAVRAAGTDGAPAAAVESFLDELITQRELAINFCLRNPHYNAYAGLPDWGRKTLAEHAADPRPALYDRDALEAGETADRLWNAAQRQMVAAGWMPNRLRMYWAKQIVLWSRTPEEAHETTVALNDRYFLDGRDANGYAQIAWSAGGRHDRPFPPNKPVLGLVRPMGMGAMKQRFDVVAYITMVERTYGR